MKKLINKEDKIAPVLGMKVVQITWLDSHRYMYQMDRDEAVNPTLIRTVGYLVKEDGNNYVLAQEEIGEGIRGVIVIPKVNVTLVLEFNIKD